jgi:hypothetical protein
MSDLEMDNASLRGSLKAMSADMRKLTRDRNAHKRESEKLQAENESLRKQLQARHPFKPEMDEITIGYTGCLICGKYTDHGGLQCPKMRAFAISSLENH